MQKSQIHAKPSYEATTVIECAEFDVFLNYVSCRVKWVKLCEFCSAIKMKELLPFNCTLSIHKLHTVSSSLWSNPHLSVFRVLSTFEVNVDRPRVQRLTLNKKPLFEVISSKSLPSTNDFSRQQSVELKCPCLRVIRNSVYGEDWFNYSLHLIRSKEGWEAFWACINLLSVSW